MIENKILGLLDLKEKISKKITEVIRNISLNKNDVNGNYFTKNFYNRKDLSKIKKKILKSYEQNIKVLDLKLKNLILSGNLENLLKNKKIKEYYFKINRNKQLNEINKTVLLNENNNIDREKENKKIILDNLRN